MHAGIAFCVCWVACISLWQKVMLHCRSWDPRGRAKGLWTIWGRNTNLAHVDVVSSESVKIFVICCLSGGSSTMPGCACAAAFFHQFSATASTSSWRDSSLLPQCNMPGVFQANLTEHLCHPSRLSSTHTSCDHKFSAYVNLEGCQTYHMLSGTDSMWSISAFCRLLVEVVYGSWTTIAIIYVKYAERLSEMCMLGPWWAWTVKVSLIAQSKHLWGPIPFNVLSFVTQQLQASPCQFWWQIEVDICTNNLLVLVIFQIFWQVAYAGSYPDRCCICQGVLLLNIATLPSQFGDVSV